MGVISNIIERRSVENPQVPLDAIFEDHPYYDSLAGGDKTDSGVRVNVQTGLGYPPVWRAVDLISSYVAKLPLHIYERTEDGGKRRAKEHPAYGLIRRKPNEYLNAFHFIKTLVANSLFTGRGNGYAYIIRNGSGDPMELLWLDPGQVTPIRRNGKLWYIYGDGARKIHPSDVIHIRGLGFDGLVGYDVVAYMRQTLGLGIGLRKFGSVFFKNHATPGVVLERPAEAPGLSEEGERNLRQAFDKIVTGLDAAHRTVVLQEGTKAYTIGVDARKAQLKEMRELEARDVAVFFGLPPHKLGDTTRTAYASLEQENQSLLDDCLDGILVGIEQELSDKLLTEDQKKNDTHFVEFLRDALVRVDLKSTVEALAIEVNNGLANLDEARAIRNRPALPDGMGQKFRMPANIMELSSDEPEPEPEPDPGPELDPGIPMDEPEPDDDGDIDGDTQERARREAINTMVAEVVRRMTKRVCAQAERAAKKPDTWLTFCEGLDEANRSVWIEAMGPAVGVLDAEHGLSSSLPDLAERYFRSASEALLSLSECQPDELVGRVKEWSEASLRYEPERFVMTMRS